MVCRGSSILMEIHWASHNGIDLDFIFMLLNGYLNGISYYQSDDIWIIAIHLLWLNIWLGVDTLWLIFIFIACNNPNNTVVTILRLKFCSLQTFLYLGLFATLVSSNGSSFLSNNSHSDLKINNLTDYNIGGESSCYFLGSSKFSQKVVFMTFYL